MPARSVRIFQVDAFTSEPFRGNPAAVCLLDGTDRDDGWMQDVAAEMNLSETAFLEPRDGGFGLRWFTPVTEIDLCGHATLASAHVLWEEKEADGRLRFETRSGALFAERDGDGIGLDFPAVPATAVVPAEVLAGLAEALGIEPVWVGSNGFDLLVEVADATTVRRLAPDIGAIGALPVRGVMVTAVDDRDCDFVSRFFGPAVGIDEDPVTGSAHCCLGPYWADRLGRTELVGYQASARGGRVGVRVRGDRVVLVGKAVTILRGELV